MLRIDEYNAVLERAGIDDVARMLQNSLFGGVPPFPVEVTRDEFSQTFIKIYDSLTSPQARRIIQLSISALMRSINFRTAKSNKDVFAEVFAIAHHVAAVEVARYLYDFSQRTIHNRSYKEFWNTLGDLVIVTMIEPIQDDDVAKYAKSLFFNDRFKQYAPMLFFRIAEVYPATYKDMLPRFLSIVDELNDPVSSHFVRQRFFEVFSVEDVCELLDELPVDKAKLLALQFVLDKRSPIYFATRQLRPPHLSARDLDDPDDSLPPTEIALFGSSGTPQEGIPLAHPEALMSAQLTVLQKSDPSTLLKADP